MHFLSVDFEWTNNYYSACGSVTNIITEFGAILLDEDFNELDSYEALIKIPDGIKIQKRISDLTGITNDLLDKEGIPFNTAINHLKRIIAPYNDVVFLFWGDCDVPVLLDNISYFADGAKLPFDFKYINAAVYYRDKSDQPEKSPSLDVAAEKLGISISEEQMHSAYYDSMVCATVFREIYNPLDTGVYTHFIDKAAYKDYFILQAIQYIRNKGTNSVTKWNYRQKLPMLLSEGARVNDDVKCFSCGKSFHIPINAVWNLYYISSRRVYTEAVCPSCKKKNTVLLRYSSSLGYIHRDTVTGSTSLECFKKLKAMDKGES